MVMKSFVLIGVIISHDDVFSTVEFNLNPATNAGPSMAVVPNIAIPCEIEVGKTIYVVKEESSKDTVISCKAESNEK